MTNIQLKIFVIDSANHKQEQGVYLIKDNWNDYGYVTHFQLKAFFDNKQYEIGSISIGYQGQEASTENPTYSKLPQTLDSLEELEDTYFSLGTTSDYYRNLSSLPDALKKLILKKLNDVVYNAESLKIALDEKVFQTSLCRMVSLSTIKGEFTRLLGGNEPFVSYSFKYDVSSSDTKKISFEIDPTSRPPSNIHVLIGSNGVGKTTLLNKMAASFLNEHDNKFTVHNESAEFSRLVHVSFNIFDDNSNHEKFKEKLLYDFIGFSNDLSSTKDDISAYFKQSLRSCLKSRSEIWHKSINELIVSTSNQFNTLNEENRETDIISQFNKMSSGYRVVVLMLTKIIEKLEEKTLILIDEPETHLHPPLLSAFVRILSRLLVDRNGVAIISTHSPIILQEVPRNCIWKLLHTGNDIQYTRPNQETFGENVSTLTHDVFGLEVMKSGFYYIIKEVISNHPSATYSDIVEKFSGNIGFEGKALIQSLLATAE